MTRRTKLLQRLKRFLVDRGGVSAVEFAVLAPIFILMLAATADFGLSLHKRFQLNSAVAAGANYALLRGPDIGEATASEIGGDIAAIVAGSSGSGTISVRVNVNGSQSVTLLDGEAVTSDGDGDADACYCPSLSGSSIEWGAARVCGSACPFGGMAGKFVEIEVSRSHTALFANITNLIEDDVRLSTLVQAQ